MISKEEYWEYLVLGNLVCLMLTDGRAMWGAQSIAVPLLMHAHKWLIGVCLGLIYAALHDSLSYSKTACQLPNGSDLKFLSILQEAEELLSSSSTSLTQIVHL